MEMGSRSQPETRQTGGPMRSVSTYRRTTFNLDRLFVLQWPLGVQRQELVAEIRVAARVPERDRLGAPYADIMGPKLLKRRNQEHL